MKKISSLQNPLIKKVLHLQEKSRERKQEGVFVIDGWKEIEMAIANEFEIETLFLRETFSATGKGALHPEVVEVSAEVFDKISYRRQASGAIAIAKQKQHSLNALSLAANPLLLVLDSIEKPGNLGAMLRTADAAGIDGVICCDMQTDIYNPNVVRSSVGCLFTVQIAKSNKEECLEFLRANHISIYTTSLQAAQNYLSCDYKNPAAFILGTEATGVDSFWEKNSDANIIIPMRGQNDSLNVSNTAAILLFEALRQRE
jgi:TrmH family RNA methyltransferase